MELTRIGVSLPSDLLERFDEILGSRGYSSRSEGIRDAIRNYILHYEWMSNIGGERVGVITLLYDHEQHGLSETLTDIQHRFIENINSSIHVHISKHLCLEVILLKGEGKMVKEVAETMMAQKGVEQIRLTTISPERF
jgi:CopG family nickel-responsive transcriptional regulator